MLYEKKIQIKRYIYSDIKKGKAYWEVGLAAPLPASRLIM